jgi:5-methylcytosine-specific restriction endonuclease McrA
VERQRRRFEFSPGTKAKARERQDGKCAKCGTNLFYHEEHAHHVVPNQSGDWEIEDDAYMKTKENCVILCDVCHEAVHNLNTRTGAVAPPSYFRWSHADELDTHFSWAAKLQREANRTFARLAERHTL